MITIAFFKWILYGDYDSFKKEVEYLKKGILFLLGKVKEGERKNVKEI